MQKWKTVEEYIQASPKSVQVKLREIRKIIRSAVTRSVIPGGVPKMEEKITYGMPGYKLNGKPLVYFADWENHIGFYATPSANIRFRKELSKYKKGRGSIQFPLDKPLPVSLIRKIVKFRAQENMAYGTKGEKTVCSRGHIFYKSKEVPVCPICWPGKYAKKKN
jgi:uncharacterized protein YdhG (YjbR/CyaY superfamily)